MMPRQFISTITNDNIDAYFLIYVPLNSPLYSSLPYHSYDEIQSWVFAQDILASGEQQTDLSGNPILVDSGVWLKGKIKSHFKDADIKYIDPSYLIRSIPTTSGDRIYCKVWIIW